MVGVRFELKSLTKIKQSGDCTGKEDVKRADQLQYCLWCGVLTDKILCMKRTKCEGLDGLGEGDAIDFGTSYGVPDGEATGAEHNSQEILTLILTVSRQ